MANRFNIQRVLVAPLDWGLGHATRCIPVIRGLIDAGCEVLVASEGAQRELLQQEFPAIRHLDLKGYRVRYSRYPVLLPLNLLVQIPRLLCRIGHEQKWLQRIIETENIQLVISDNRYGLYTSICPCIFITHQLRIRAPFRWLENLLQKINYRYINRYTACWVPDMAGEVGLAGELSHPQRLPAVPVHYIGLPTRFRRATAEKKYDHCVLVSGPEPQRTLFEKKVLAGLQQLPGRTLLVRGKPGSNEQLAAPEGVDIVNHLSTTDLQQALQQSELVIARSGYTTVMELMTLQKKAILVPTPGQTEQEYLATYLADKNLALSVKQSTLDLSLAIKARKNFPYQTLPVQLFEPAAIKVLLQASV